MSVGTPAASLAGLTLDPEKLKALPEEEQARVAAQLAELDAALKANPLLRYNHPSLSRPHPKQVRFHEGPWPRTRLFIGGNRSGKTTATHVDTIMQCLDRDAVPEHLLPFKRWEPPFYCRIVGPDLTRWLEGIALQKFREWCPRSQLKGGSFQHGWDKQQMMLRFKNGSWVQFMSNDQDLEKFTGAALHRVVYDESPREDIWSECRVRLRDYMGEEIFGLTPMDGMSNWLYDLFYAPWEVLEGEGLEAAEIDRALGFRFVLVSMDDNPHLPPDEEEWTLEGKSQEEKDARKTGRFISFSGLIFPSFHRDRHVIPDIDPDIGLPPGVEVFEGLDPGMREMAAIVFCYLDQQDRLVVYDELPVKGKTVERVVELIHEKRKLWRTEPRWTVIDPSARNKSPQTGRSEQSEYQKHGVLTFPGQNDVPAGINAVRERLEADPPRLLVCHRCVVLQEQFKKYRWGKPSGRSEDDPRPRPVKRDDHCFVAGTLIDTEDGRRPIESVRPGERVWTRKGLFPALLAGKTREHVDTRVLRLEDGSELCGTPDHPVYVSRRGWVSLGSVRYGDKMLVWRNGAKKSSGTESSSTVTPTRTASAPVAISSPRQSDCTVPSGSSTTDQSPMATTFTIATATRETTTSQTSSVFRPESICRPVIGTRTAVSWLASECDPLFGPLPMRGTVAPMGSPGTASTHGASSRNASRNRSSASTAELRSKASSVATCGSAQTTVSPRGAAPLGLTMLTGRASGAVRPTERIATPNPKLVPLRVVANSPGPNAEVFNLTVLGPPEYFANGILVHNCLDALRYVVMARPLRPELNPLRKGETMKDRILKHHLRRLHPKRRQLDSGFGPGQFA